MKNLLKIGTTLFLCLSLMLTALLTGCDGLLGLDSEAEATLVFAEVMSDNGATLSDEDGEYPDYIVLYNPGSERVNLTNWHLTDNVTNSLKWTMPSVYLDAGGYLVIFASGKDRIDTTNGIYHTSFSLKAAGETVALVSPRGSIISELTIPNLATDIAYGRVMDGETAGTYEFFSKGMPGQKNTSVHATTMQQLLQSGDNKIYFTEYMNNNQGGVKDNNGEFSDFVELYNASEETVSLGGMYLSDNVSLPMKWAIPGGVTLAPGQRTVVWCSGRDTYEDGAMHASFALGKGDKQLLLSDSAGMALACIELDYLPENISKGVKDGELSSWLYYAAPTPGKENATTAYSDLMAACSLKNAGVWINEVSSVPTSEGSYDWIELYNGTNSDISLDGWGISHDLALGAEYTFSGVTIKAGGYLLLYASGGTPESTSAGSIYLPFKISNSGTRLYLLSPEGTVKDFFHTGKLCIGYTSGRKGDLRERYFFASPTPKAKNGTGYTSYAAVPSLSSSGGYASIGDKITASGLQGQTLRYTTDGSTPTASSPVFDSLSISKTVVLKVRAFQDGRLPSETVVATYVVGNHDIPFVSLSGDPDGFFGYNNGILANGPGYSEPFPYSGANFWKDWERQATFEYFTPESGKAVAFDCGVNVFGQYSRAYDQKSLAVHLRDKYGTSDVTYPFFENNDITTVSHMVLRAGGQDYKATRIRDAFCSEVMQGHTTLISMDWQPVALYINGAYWGFFDLREKINEEYLASHEGLDKDNVTIIKGDSRVVAGSNTEIKALYAYAKNNDLSKAEHYNYMAEQMDMDNFIDYLIAEIYFANGDTGNKKCYKENTLGSKWRWVIFDFDMSMRNESLWGDKYNTIEMLFNPGGHGSNNGFTSALQYNLSKNSTFREKFITRYAELLNTIFMPESMRAVLKGMTDKMDSEMKQHVARWGTPTSYDKWVEEVANLNRIIDKRREIAKKQLIAFFSMSDAEVAKLFPNN